ncbi:MAG TPA: family 43 glycosylhydrolase, partial [Kofleriaceae bacterium]|nr:family 43 glycosylhydrolase [Kofleriaceae bacterium]
EVPAAGVYTFATVADDGVRLWVDDQRVLDDWTFHAATRVEGSAELAAGFVPIRLEYFDAGLFAEVSLRWLPPGAAGEEVVPGERLRALASGGEAPKPPYINPVVPFDCPDPGVVEVRGGGFAMVCTGGRFPVRRSADLVLWEDSGAAVLPDGKPAWAANGFRNWAPEIHRVGGGYVAYYTSVNGADVLSVGAASAPDPFGTWTDRGAPLVEAAVGVIDASHFEDGDGKHYLLYKIDGNSQGQPTPIYLRELAADGLSFAAGSQPVELLRNDPSSWEGGVVEAPWLVRRRGTYYLFYSGNVYDHRYRTGVARSAALAGPYEKLGPPILGNNERWVGPGHGSIVALGDGDYFVYHAWPAAPGGVHDQAAGRHVLVDRIEWGADGWPHIHDGTPSRTLQAWPDSP